MSHPSTSVGNDMETCNGQVRYQGRKGEKSNKFHVTETLFKCTNGYKILLSLIEKKRHRTLEAINTYSHVYNYVTADTSILAKIPPDIFARVN